MRQSAPIIILGPQTPRPALAEVLRRAGLSGPMLSITAGWQEREGELAALEAHLGQKVEDLRLYARAEAVLHEDPEFFAAHRLRQDQLRRVQDLYRVRLDHAKAAARALQSWAPDSALARTALQEAIVALRRLDFEHLRKIARMHEAFDERWQPRRRPSVQRHVDELRASVAGAGCVLIAGGHVAVLLNRLRLFGAADWLRPCTLVAWSAGAMVLTERVVLFHDHPPQGAGNAEVLEAGLGLLPQAVLLPQASRRLALKDRARIALLARRFAPRRCYALDAGSWLRFADGQTVDGGSVQRLSPGGAVRPLQFAA